MDKGESLVEEIERGWRLVGTAVVGSAHQKVGLPCQDALDYRVILNGSAGSVLLVALADGAGSAELADLGAHCAVDVAMRSMAAAIQGGLPEERTGWDALLCKAFDQARQALERLADEQTEPLRAFATTLTCVIAAGEWLAVGQLGDGAVVAGEDHQTLFVVARTQRGEYANETYFLTQADALEQVEVQVLEQPVSLLAVMSDGLIRLALRMPSHAPHLPFFQPLFAFTAAAESEAQAAGQLAAFLASERVCARTDDDKSLVLAIRPTVSTVETIAERRDESI